MIYYNKCMKKVSLLLVQLGAGEMTAPYLNNAMNPICDHFVAARKFSCDSCWEPLLQATLWRGLIQASISNEGHLWFTILFTSVTAQTTHIYAYIQPVHFSHSFVPVFSLILFIFSLHSHLIYLSSQLLLLSSCVPVITCLSSLHTNNHLYRSKKFFWVLYWIYNCVFVQYIYIVT